MFDFMMTPEQLALREAVRDLVRWVPRQMILDMDADKLVFPKEFLAEAGRRNLMGCRYPERWGGRGMDWATTVMVMPAYRHAAHRVFNAAELTYTAASAETATTVANPLGRYRVVESRLAYRRLVAASVGESAAKKYWLIGDFTKAFAYMENWPITVTQAPTNSEAEFNQDIVARFKASERGAAAVLNPRYAVLSTGAGA